MDVVNIIKERSTEDGKIVISKVNKRYCYSIFDSDNSFELFFANLSQLPLVKYKINRAYELWEKNIEAPYIHRTREELILTRYLFREDENITGNYLKINRWKYIRDLIEETMKDYKIEDKIRIDTSSSLCSIIRAMLYNREIEDGKERIRRIY